MTSYPNREHENADKAARRRALANLGAITAAAGIMRQKLERDGTWVDGSDARQLAVAVGQLTENLTIIETLRDVREWWRADQAGIPEQLPDMSPETRAKVRAALDAADPVRGKGRDLR